MPQNADFNSAPAQDNFFRHFISSLNPDDPSVTWINAGALDFLSRLERDGRLFELRAFTSPTATVLSELQRSLLFIQRLCKEKVKEMSFKSQRDVF